MVCIIFVDFLIIPSFASADEQILLNSAWKTLIHLILLLSANIDDRKQYVGGCKFMWNIESNQYRITDVLQMKEVKSDFVHSENKSHLGFPTMPWNPTKHIVPQMRNKIQQMYTRPIRYLHNEMTLSGISFFFTSINLYICSLKLITSIIFEMQFFVLGESIMRLKDMDNLTEFYITPIPNC